MGQEQAGQCPEEGSLLKAREPVGLSGKPAQPVHPGRRTRSEGSSASHLKGTLTHSVVTGCAVQEVLRKDELGPSTPSALPAAQDAQSHGHVALACHRHHLVHLSGTGVAAPSARGPLEAGEDQAWSGRLTPGLRLCPTRRPGAWLLRASVSSWVAGFPVW